MAGSPAGLIIPLSTEFQPMRDARGSQGFHRWFSPDTSYESLVFHRLVLQDARAPTLRTSGSSWLPSPRDTTCTRLLAKAVRSCFAKLNRYPNQSKRSESYRQLKQHQVPTSPNQVADPSIPWPSFRPSTWRTHQSLPPGRRSPLATGGEPRVAKCLHNLI